MYKDKRKMKLYYDRLKAMMPRRYKRRYDHRVYSQPITAFYFRRRIKHAVDLGEIKPNHQVLDVGCGSGISTFLLTEHSNFVVGLDISEEMLKDAKGFSKKMHKKNVNFVQSDCEHLPFIDNAFNAVVCMDLLHHVQSMENAVVEMSRVCQLGGRVVAVEFSANNPMLLLFFWLFRADERGIFRSTSWNLEKIFLGAQLTHVKIDYLEAIPFHPRIVNENTINAITVLDSILLKSPLTRPLGSFIIMAGLRSS